MTCSNIYELYNIPIYYRDLKSKKIFTRALSEIDINRKKIHLIYYKKSELPICALPKINTVIVSKKSFLSFCYNFYFFINSFSTEDIKICPENIYLIAKFALCHEVGHLLDKDLQSIKSISNEILISIAKNIIKYNIDFKNLAISNKNLPLELKDSIIEFNKNIIKRELNAWNIGFDISNISNEKEKYLFDKMKEYSLATYNYSNFKNFVLENNVEKYLKNI